MVGIFIIVCCCRCCLVALDSLVILLLLPLLRDLRRFVGHDKYTKTFSGFFQFFALFSPLPHSPSCCLLFVHSLCAGGGRRTKCQARPGQATTRSQLLLPLSQQFKTQFARCSRCCCCNSLALSQEKRRRIRNKYFKLEANNYDSTQRTQ